MGQLYYVDTCVWLNLFNLEQGHGPIPDWVCALRFFEAVLSCGGTLLISSCVMRELEWLMAPSDFAQLDSIFAKWPVEKIGVVLEDRNEARKIESSTGFTLSFFDSAHIALTRRLGAVLVTRDRLLIASARKLGVRAFFPEELEMY